MNFLLEDRFRRQALAAALTGFPCAVVPLLILGMLTLNQAGTYGGEPSAAETIGRLLLAAAGGLALLLLNLGLLLIATKEAADQRQAAQRDAETTTPRPVPEPFRNAAGIPLSRQELKQACRRKKQEAEQFMWAAATPCALLFFLHLVLLFLYRQIGWGWSLLPLALFLVSFFLAVKRHGQMEAEIKELRRQRRAAPKPNAAQA